MAPSFDHLRDADVDEDDYDENEIDLSDLREKYEVQLEQGFDTFVVIDGLPEVTEEQKPKLVKFLLKKLKSVGNTKEESIFMPMGDDGKSMRFAFVEYSTAAEAAAAVRQLDLVRPRGPCRGGVPTPVIEEFKEKEHMRSWLADPSGRGRDQFAMYRGETVGVFWNNEKDTPENVVDRQHWTESFIQWSPLGTFLTSVHQQGVQLWGGPSWTRQRRFAHPFVNMLDFSPGEKYVVTWSNRPISIPDEGHPQLAADDDGKNYVIWEVETGKPLRSFANLDLPTTGPDGQPLKAPPKFPWPAFKWSADDKYVARLTQGQSISVYELPRMTLLDKTTIKIEGVMDFEWAPATVQRDGNKSYEQLFCYWTPELGSNPAKVGLMSIPSKEVVRSLNLFSVSDAKLHWQSDGTYLAVKVDRHSKSKKSQATTLEIFRVREKGVPVEVVDTIKDTVINFAWEPKGDRFVIITTTEPVGQTAVPPKTSVAFFCPEKVKGNVVGNFKHLRTLEKKNSNSSDLEFYDMDFEGEKPESDKDLTANLQLMNISDHYGVTDVQWDPSGRFVTSWASAWKHAMENGYHIYDFKGEQLREEPLEKFKQWAWRPRPATLLTKEEQKQIRKNLREYSKTFEQEDAERVAGADQAVVEERRRMLDEWYAWRQSVEEELEWEREELGLSKPAEAAAKGEDAEGEVIEEIVEEVLEETEEIVQ
ncbi:eukaryotic translation initiation factor eIF2A-domain-containing protein [Apiospora hydei]|uniref:Eukaryotic translation initiation factor 3 subunit B n=1 Tax=Apiospora hydei TaxID=1337664 RepID=A0ABR1X7P0_9PEZI